MDTKYSYSEIEIKLGTELTEEEKNIISEVSKIYSEDYGYWTTGDKVRISPKSFLILHKGSKLWIAKKDSEIIGFCITRGRGNDILITSECIKKEYRNTGVFKGLISYILGNKNQLRLGVISKNPIVLWTLETTNPDMSYIDLDSEISRDSKFGVSLSIFIDDFRRRSYGILKVPYKRAGEINYKKLETGFFIQTPESELLTGCKDLGQFYTNLMGELGDYEEWLLFVKYDRTRPEDNTLEEDKK